MRSVINFLRILFDRRKEEVTFLLLEEDRPSNPMQYKLRPQEFFMAGIIVVLLFAGLMFTLLYVTPVGNMIFDKDEAQIRSELFHITQRIVGLQDSLAARDEQLTVIKNVLAQGNDTLFSIRNLEHLDELFPVNNAPAPTFASQSEERVRSALNSEHIIFSNVFKLAPQFPTQVPAIGTVSQQFNLEKRHFGIDIAAQTGTLVRSVADGVVINSDWTLNYGYVVNIQHGGGYVSVYKHLQNVLLREGDIVMNGDVIGSIGRSGFLTTGPHLHFELWKDGVPMDPSRFLVNL